MKQQKNDNREHKTDDTRHDIINRKTLLSIAIEQNNSKHKTTEKTIARN